MERIKTGIPGLDEILEGGIPEGNLVLVSGVAGTGKTTLSAQFLYNGAAKFNENGLFVPEQLDADTRRYYFDELAKLGVTVDETIL